MELRQFKTASCNRRLAAVFDFDAVPVIDHIDDLLRIVQCQGTVRGHRFGCTRFDIDRRLHRAGFEVPFILVFIIQMFLSGCFGCFFSRRFGGQFRRFLCAAVRFYRFFLAAATQSQ